MQRTQDNIKLFGNLITASGIFCLAVALLLLINYWHIRQNKPLETEALKSLVQQFQSDPESEVLKKEIRSLDLLARKAFFTTNWQIKTGAFLLLLGGIAFATFLRIYHTMKAKILEPLIEGMDSKITRMLSQRWILITGGLLLGSALVASFLTTDYLKIYEETGSVVQAPAVAPAEASVKVAVVDGAEKTEDGGQKTEDVKTVRQEDVKTVKTVEGDAGTLVIPAKAGRAPGNLSTESFSVIPAKAGITTLSTDFRNNHPSFRGPFGQGISYNTGIPVDWDGPSGKNIKWKVALTKKGYNSPVIWGDKLFIAGADNESEVVYCFNRLDGKLLWEQAAKDIPGSPVTPPKVTADTGLSAPSVTTDGQHVYAIFATGDIVALDMEGKRIWAKNLGVPDNHYGHSSSLICWKDKVIIQFDTNKGGRLLALNSMTGEISWDTPRKSKISWSSPILAEIDGKLQIITTSSPTVAGFDFDSGAQIWAIDCLSGEVGPSAAYGDGLVFAANEYATLAAIKPGPTPVIVWQSDEYLPEAASPAVSGGLLFIATSYGMFACYDAKTGTKQWEKEYGQGFYGSPMIAEGKVYVMDRSGAMHIFKVDRTLTSLGDPV
ncbi:MAG: PQQ-binding-like beta-propeller repeat protein, partial [Bacteroidia bacterium]|nr:PQQ-binding-like beta-propeller repeat protein [Bacteroidia bacterium]